MTPVEVMEVAVDGMVTRARASAPSGVAGVTGSTAGVPVTMMASGPSVGSLAGEAVSFCLMQMRSMRLLALGAAACLTLMVPSLLSQTGPYRLVTASKAAMSLFMPFPAVTSPVRLLAVMLTPVLMLPLASWAVVARSAARMSNWSAASLTAGNPLRSVIVGSFSLVV